jgi:hypothetical protein
MALTCDEISALTGRSNPELRAAAVRARELLRRLLTAKKLGVEYAEANQICHEITAALGDGRQN